MPDGEQQETLSERVVKEAIGMGMESEMRETIVEAVEDAEGGPSRGGRLSAMGAMLGLGAAFGYLLGTRSEQLVEEGGSIVEEMDEPEIIEEAEEVGEEVTGAESEEESAGGKRRLPRIVLGLGALAGAALLRRRLQSGEEEEWEPIEEFTTTSEEEEEEEAESEGESEEEVAEDEEEAAEDEEEEEATEDEETEE